jgi:hypothetical protein
MDEIQSQQYPDELQSQPIPESESSEDEHEILTQQPEEDDEPDEFQATQALLEEDNHEQCINNFKDAMDQHDIDIDSLRQYVDWLQTQDLNQMERIQTALRESGLSLTQVKAYVYWADKKIKKKL